MHGRVHGTASMVEKDFQSCLIDVLFVIIV
jgi:hypothetical protein